MSAPGTLTYPEFDGLARLEENKQPVKLNDATDDWKFNHADHEFIGTITASIESREDFDGDLVGVFVDDKCRGIAERMYFPFDDRYMYIIQVYSNMVEGEKLHFKYHDSNADKVMEFEETLTFSNNMVVGDGFNTFALSREVGEGMHPMSCEISDAYPNPFNPVTSFSYVLPEDGMVNVSVYDINGRQVAELVNGFRMAGSHPLTWNASDLSSGVYIVKMIANDEHAAVQKIMLMK
jgi:hypothetical protein